MLPGELLLRLQEAWNSLLSRHVFLIVLFILSMFVLAIATQQALGLISGEQDTIYIINVSWDLAKL